MSIAITQIAVGVFGDAVWHEPVHLAALTWQLAIAFMGFAMLLYGERAHRSD